MSRSSVLVALVFGLVALLGAPTPASAQSPTRAACRARCADIVDGCASTLRQLAPHRRVLIKRLCRRRALRLCLRDGEAACPVPQACAGDAPPSGLTGLWSGPATGCFASGAGAETACDGTTAPLLLAVTWEGCETFAVSEPFVAAGTVGGGAFSVTSSEMSDDSGTTITGRLEGDTLADVHVVRTVGGAPVIRYEFAALTRLTGTR